MATIDQEGLEEVKKIKDALTHIYDKVASSGADVNEEYSFIFKILTQMEDDWNHDINRVYTVPEELTINGKRYTS
jgi:hypothetical protein